MTTKAAKAVTRTSQGLRDILFDEITALRGPKGDTTRAMAVANLAKQIVNTAKVEMDFLRATADLKAKARTPRWAPCASGRDHLFTLRRGVRRLADAN